MKKIKYFGILFLLFGLNIMGVSAKASASLSVNKSSVENGSKVTQSRANQTTKYITAPLLRKSSALQIRTKNKKK